MNKEVHIPVSKIRSLLKEKNYLDIVKYIAKTDKDNDIVYSSSWFQCCIVYVIAEEMKIAVNLEDMISVFEEIYQVKITRLKKR